MDENLEILNISELYGYDDDDLPDGAYPIRYRNIAKSQKPDAKIQQKLVHINTIASTTFVGVTKTIV